MLKVIKHKGENKDKGHTTIITLNILYIFLPAECVSDITSYILVFLIIDTLSWIRM